MPAGDRGAVFGLPSDPSDRCSQIRAARPGARPIRPLHRLRRALHGTVLRPATRWRKSLPRAALAPASRATSRQRFGSVRASSATCRDSRRRSGGRRPDTPETYGGERCRSPRPAAAAARLGCSGNRPASRARRILAWGWRSRPPHQLSSGISAVPISLRLLGVRLVGQPVEQAAHRVPVDPQPLGPGWAGRPDLTAGVAHRTLRVSHLSSSSSTASA